MIPYTTYDYFKPMMGTTEIDDKGQPHFVVDKEKLHKNYLVPTPVEWKDDEPPVEIVDFAIGKYHIIVLGRKKGEYGTRVYSAGGNANGQLGLGHYRQEHALTEIKELSTKRIGGVSAGTYHCIAVGMTGEEVYTWGNAISGRLGISDGDPPMKTYPLPQKVAFPDSFAVGDRVVDVTCGEETTFAVTAHGHLYVWGYNVYSQTGFNCNYGDIYRPRKMDPMDSIKLTNPGAKQCHVLRVASGAQHTMLLIKRYE
jgi:alpha-tubulin suppressor-like RCC1 family protein